MYKDSIKQMILTILTREVLIKSDRIHSFVFFDTDLCMDERDLNVLLYYVEDYYGIRIPEHHIGLHSRMSELVASIDRLWLRMTEDPERVYMKISA